MVRHIGFFLFVLKIFQEQISDIMDEDSAEVESDETTDKIINEIEAQIGGGKGGQKEVQKQDVNCVISHRKTNFSNRTSVNSKLNSIT